MPGHDVPHAVARWAGLGLLGLGVTGLACGGGGNGGGPSPSPTSVQVTSESGTRLAVGRTKPLRAVARDARGNEMPGARFTWRSTNDFVATVNPGGVVTGASAGSATISAETEGVTGSLALQVSNADLDGIGVALNDAFAGALVTSLTGPVRGRVQAALAQCQAGVTQGNFTTIETCLTSLRAEATAATDPTDQVLLASLALFVEHAQRLLDRPLTVATVSVVPWCGVLSADITGVSV